MAAGAEVEESRHLAHREQRMVPHSGARLAPEQASGRSTLAPERADAYAAKLSPGKPRHGWTSYTKTSALTLGSSYMIVRVSSTLVAKIPMPLTSLSSVT